VNRIYLYKSSSGREVVAEFINSLDEITKGRTRNSIRILEKHGLELLKNRSVKKIARKPDIFELRMIGKKQVRVLFVTHKENIYILLHAFVKKTQKTPTKEIELAQKRAREFV
jgi:phage-related protein